MNASESRRRFAEARVARLATRGEGPPRLLPIVFAIAGDDIVTAVDHKPKSTRDLRRLSDISHDPRVAVLVDHYDDADWSRLWWVRADGIATVHDGDATAHRAIDHLVDRYSQYRRRRPVGPVISVSVSRWSGWAADPGR